MIETPGALVMPNQSRRDVDGDVFQVKLIMEPTGVARSIVNVVVASRKSVTLTAIGPAALTWLKALQNVVVQVNAPIDENSGVCELPAAFELRRASENRIRPKMY